MTKRLAFMLVSVLGMLLWNPTGGLANSADYYVNTSGNDSNSGSFSAPFATIQKAVTVARAGQTISVAAGVYRETVTIDKKVGRASAPIRLIGAPGAIIDGGTPLTRGWREAPEIGPGVYVNDNLPFRPDHFTIADKFVLPIRQEKMESGNWRSQLRTPSSPRCTLPVTTGCDDYATWNGVEAIYGVSPDGTRLYVGSRSGANPASLKPTIAQYGIGALTIKDSAHVAVSGFTIRNGWNAAYITDSNYITLSGNDLQGGILTVGIWGDVNHSVVENNKISLAYAGGSLDPNRSDYWFLWRMFRVVSQGSTFCVSMYKAGSNNIIRDNEFRDCFSAIADRTYIEKTAATAVEVEQYSRNLVVSGNRLTSIYHSAMVIGSGGFNHHWHSNTLRDVGTALRFDLPTKGPIYVYNNYADNSNFDVDDDRRYLLYPDAATNAVVFFYHNKVIAPRMLRSFQFGHAEYLGIRGMPNAVYVNNIFQSRNLGEFSPHASASGAPAFDYNLVLASVTGGQKSFMGRNNVYASGQEVGRGADLSKPWSVKGKRFPALPNADLAARASNGNVTIGLFAHNPDQTPAPDPGLPLGPGKPGVVYEIWPGLATQINADLDDLKQDPRYPSEPEAQSALATLDAPHNVYDISSTQYFGSRLRALLTPSTSGEYEFFLAADDSAELLLSTDASPDNARQIALVTRWTEYGDYTCTSSRAENCAVNQTRSAPVQLEAGQSYYVEVNHVESVGADHASVAWRTPGSDTIVPLPTANLTQPGAAPEPCTSAGVLYETWTELTTRLNASLDDLKQDPRYPSQPVAQTTLSTLEAVHNLHDLSTTQYFGSRMRALLTPSTSGEYEFFLAADDSAELLLSTDASPDNARQLALVERWMEYGDYLCAISRAESCAVNQTRSAPVQLEAGQSYYIEVNHVESVGADHASVAWTTPGSDAIVPLPTATLTRPPDETGSCAPSGVVYETWPGIASQVNADLDDLKRDPRYPSQPAAQTLVSTLEAPHNVDDLSSTQYFGSRMRALLTPSTSGEYEFFLAADDSAELLLSTDASPDNTRRIALVTRWMQYGDYTCTSSSAEHCAVNQTRSGPVQLEAGKSYYIEVNHVESVGADHASVAWRTPSSSEIIPLPASILRPPPNN